ncbi:universal stress protein [Maribacter sp. Asnod1-A12]|uniref:universal stress protein n=1 Tax=Maribacter sp. Asnod1-A12 TaxID=3160576 RepID=UPI00386F5ABA
MKHILIPTDFSHNSWNALEYALQFFRNISCTFYVLNIDEQCNSDVADNSILVKSKHKKVSVREKLNDLAYRIKNLTTNNLHQFIILEELGGFTDIIKKTVDDKKIDLIVMGTKGASGSETRIFGHNTSNVITKVPCNVLVIPEKTIIKSPNKIAFPTDFNLFYNYPILNSITEILELSSASLEVLHMSQTKSKFTSSQIINKTYLLDYLKELFSESHSFHNILGTDVKNSVINYIDENKIEMMTMLAKNINLFQQLFFTNSIEQSSFHSTIPLLVIHE